jgi:hypothetical protein
METEQPWVDNWPMWNEPLSKVTAALDIAAAREKLARKFNQRRVRLAKEIEIERAWEQHTLSTRPRQQDSTSGAALPGRD